MDKIIRINPPQNIFNDLYHYLTKMRWPLFILFAFAIFTLLNLFFAMMYAWQPGSLGDKDISFYDYFFFSVQTFSTVGYGNLGPKTFYADVISSFEIFVGVFYTALTTGLIFAKFALPKSKILFSDKLILTKMNGEDTLIFRIANGRSNKIMDARISLNFVYDDVTQEGLKLRRFEELPLVKQKTPFFSLSLLGMHTLKTGALQGLNKEMIQDKRIEFIISVKGMDETYGQSMHITRQYTGEALEWGGMFADILELKPDGTRKIDFSKFNEIVKT